ncbi:Proteins of 100 residues with WXG [Evansella caseinilytica]|uniref:Proteins of 100 residues with WXG n=1 Tax=Evansella caseinilytica TaxID=1503961 RepID=A0A1H3TK61_9BACI|nr:WXG100 family type VII secretion target [Evansella caseinilytica]SDZ50500.1 Proteins of 100 residues with WXG [Evansella caseinilytica]
MSDVNINIYKLDAAKQAAQALENSITTSHRECKKLLSYVESSKWSGKARDAFLCYLEIIYQYHGDLKEAAALQTKALKNLDKYMDDFNRDSAVREVRNL